MSDLVGVPSADGEITEYGSLVLKVVREPEELYLVELFGDLDMVGAKGLERHLRHAEASTAQRIMVDLSGLDFIDSQGLSVLHRAYERERRNGARLVFLRGQGSVERTLGMTELDRVLPFAD